MNNQSRGEEIMKKMIDLRSDTVTKPSQPMLEAMMQAEVGDDVYIEDPTINRLQEMSAELLGHEAALYFPTGSMANQVAINIHAQPGEEVICEAQGHIFNYEMATMSALSGTLPRPIPGDDGFLTAALVKEEIRPKIYYRAQTGLVSLENTHNLQGGRVHPQHQVEEIITLCRENEIPVHLDGARIFNAAVASGVAVKELTKNFDSVQFCLSKGLGAPIGSMLTGSQEFIDIARSKRKMFGGGMRQVGILGAAGLYALENNIDRLADDHVRAKRLGEALVKLPYVTLDAIETNILVFSLDRSQISAPEFVDKLKKFNIIGGAFTEGIARLCTHLDVDDADIDYVCEVLNDKF
jgi:threonine aldolase